MRILILAADAPVMAVVTLQAADGSERRVKQVDAMLYERGIDEGDTVYFLEDQTLVKEES